MPSYDLIVVGSGLAGLNAAREAARYGQVLLVTKARLDDCNTTYAQGGIAAALAPDDTPALHYQDTVVAADGLADPAAVRVLAEEGPACVRDLLTLGVPFDRVGGEIAFTREAAHSRSRILHAGGDATGARIEVTLTDRLGATPRVTVRENCFVADLIVGGERVTGVRLLDVATGSLADVEAGGVVLATGGAGQLFAHTTNPRVATGDGVALAYRAGAEVADLEFVQFHPTALCLPNAPRFLISEAVRGEGGVLVNAAGERFMERYDPRRELAPRDVVARSIVFEMQRTGAACVFLDVTHLGAERVRRRFPTISRVCGEFGVDVGREPIPVAPAAHYLMGGVWTDTWGQTSLPGLYACGECACTGVHGANRLASNSLLEALVFSSRAVRRHFCLAGEDDPPGPGRARVAVDDSAGATDDLLAPRRVVVPVPPRRRSRFPEASEVRERLWSGAGLIRDAAGLAGVRDVTSSWLASAPSSRLAATLETINLVTVGRLLATAALERTESRGAHYRADYPARSPEWRRRIVLVADRRSVLLLGGERARRVVAGGEATVAAPTDLVGG